MVAQRRRADAHAVERVGQAEKGIDQHDRGARLAVHRIAERIHGGGGEQILGLSERRRESFPVGGEEICPPAEGHARIQVEGIEAVLSAILDNHDGIGPRRQSQSNRPDRIAYAERVGAGVFLVLIADLAKEGDATQNGVACLECGDEAVRVVIDAVADILGAVDTRLQRQPAEILTAAHHRKAAMRRVIFGRARAALAEFRAALAEIGKVLRGILERIAGLHRRSASETVH